MPEGYMTTSEVAKKLGITSQAVRNLIKTGRLPAQTIGRYFVIKESDLVLIENRKRGRPHKSSLPKQT